MRRGQVSGFFERSRSHRILSQDELSVVRTGSRPACAVAKIVLACNGYLEKLEPRIASTNNADQ